MNRILAGTDGSASATTAVRWAASLARAVEVDLIVVTALGPGLEGSDVQDAIEQRNRVSRLLDTDWCASARATRPGLQTRVVDGDPRTALLDVADAQDADLLVLGSTGTSWFPAPHIGHVAHAIAHHTRVPLVVVPHDGVPPIEGPVLLGVDGSPGSAAAIAWAADLARSLDCEAIAVHVHPQNIDDGSRTELDRSIAKWTAPLRDAAVTTRMLNRQGWPANIITELEKTEQPALVVIGTRGAGGFRDLRLGSVGLQLLQHARVPVAVIPQRA